MSTTAIARSECARTRDEIDEQLRRAHRENESGLDSTYMDGVIAAVEWLLGRTDDEPMET